MWPNEVIGLLRGRGVATIAGNHDAKVQLLTALNNWGEQFERIIGYFKNHDRESPGTIEDIYAHFGMA